MVAVRLDRRLAARVDPSDVVQEALADAAPRPLDDYLRDRPLPFYPWLRQARLGAAGRAPPPPPPVASKRSVDREEPAGRRLPDESAAVLAERPGRQRAPAPAAT